MFIFIYLSIYLFIYSFIYLSIYLSTYLFIYVYTFYTKPVTTEDQSYKGLLPCVLKLKRKLKRKLKLKLKIKRTSLYLIILLTCVLKRKLNSCVSATDGSVSDFLRLRRPADTLYGSRLLVGGRGEGGWGDGDGGMVIYSYR